MDGFPQLPTTRYQFIGFSLWLAYMTLMQLLQIWQNRKQLEKQDIQAIKTDEIKDNVNGSMHAARQEIAELRAQVSALKTITGEAIKK